jgi:lipopolysaccharide export system permease protein
MQFLWKYIDDLLGKGYGVMDYFELIFYFGIAVIPMALPLTVLLSSVMTYGDMAEKYELTAMKSSGISLYRMLMPGLAVALMTMTFSIFSSNYLKPQANKKYLQKVREMRTNQLTFAFDEKIFNQEFKNFSIWIDKKEADGRTIEGVRIYDHSDPDKSIMDMIYAAKGEMYTTSDQKYLIMQLYEGYAIKEVRSESAIQDIKSFNRRGRPVNRIYFKKLRKTFSLSELLNLTVTDISSKQYDMMNSFELLDAIDTMSRDIKQIIDESLFTYSSLVEKATVAQNDEYSPDVEVDSNIETSDEKMMSEKIAEKMKALSVNRTVPIQRPVLQTTILKEVLPDTFSRIDELIVDNERYVIFDNALNTARALRDRSFNRSNEVRLKKDESKRYELRLHQQYSWAAVCLIFLFIGGPAGAIVRKGGFGMPLLIAIVFYMIFIMSYISGEKLLRSKALDAIGAAWLPCMILAPFAIYLTYMALNDQNINGIGSIKAWINKMVSLAKDTILSNPK